MKQKNTKIKFVLFYVVELKSHENLHCSAFIQGGAIEFSLPPLHRNVVEGMKILMPHPVLYKIHEFFEDKLKK